MTHRSMSLVECEHLSIAAAGVLLVAAVYFLRRVEDSFADVVQ